MDQRLLVIEVDIVPGGPSEERSTGCAGLATVGRISEGWFATNCATETCWQILSVGNILTLWLWSWGCGGGCLKVRLLMFDGIQNLTDAEINDALLYMTTMF